MNSIYFLLHLGLALGATPTLITLGSSSIIELNCGHLFPVSTARTAVTDLDKRANRSEARVLVKSTGTSSEGIAIDSTGTYLYVGYSWINGGIERYALNNATDKVVISAGVAPPAASTWKARIVRVTSTHLYWLGLPASTSGNSTVNRLLLANPTQSTQLFVGAPRDDVLFDLDKTNNYVYIMTTTQLIRMSFDGSGQTTVNVMSNVDSRGAMLVVPHMGHIYYAGGSFGYLHRMHVDGTHNESLSDYETFWDRDLFDTTPTYGSIFPGMVSAMRYDPIDDQIYFLAGSYFLLAAPSNTTDLNSFISGLVVKQDVRKLSMTDFELGWNIPSRQETSCRVPCDLPSNKCNAPNGLCMFDIYDVAQTKCLCQSKPPPSVPTKYFGPQCSTTITNPCVSEARSWDDERICSAPQWNPECTVENASHTSYKCACPVRGESNSYLAQKSVCICPSNNPKYVTLLGSVACGTCTGATCMCSETSPTAMLNAVPSACECMNATDCSQKVCVKNYAPSAACRAALTKVKYCSPLLNSGTGEESAFGFELISCDVNWFVVPGSSTPTPPTASRAPTAPTPPTIAAANSALPTEVLSAASLLCLGLSSFFSH